MHNQCTSQNKITTKWGIGDTVATIKNARRIHFSGSYSDTGVYELST
jgi:hypothetical protein